jgi:hypothetical protein
MIDQDQGNKITDQVERWDLYARLTPTGFLVTCVLLIVYGVIDFETAFYVGVGMFAVTAVVWWWWAIFTIRHLVILLNRASKNLVEVASEVKDVTQEVEQLKNES